MTVLYGRFDPITGALLETALSRKMDELWREEDPRAQAHPGPADGRCFGGVGHPRAHRRRQPPPEGSETVADRRLRRRLQRTTQRPPRRRHTLFPWTKIRDLACQSDILPGIFRGAVTAPRSGTGTEDRQHRPTNGSHRPRQGTVWDAAPTPTGARVPPHHPLGGRGQHRHRRHVLAMFPLPPQSPRRPMAGAQETIRAVLPQTTTETQPPNTNSRRRTSYQRRRRAAMKQRK